MELEQLRDAFNAKAQAWDEYTRTPIGRLREELTWQYLSRHLPDARHTPVALDAGGGTGGLAISLAQRGFKVHLVDLASAMLDLARARAGADGSITYHPTPVDEVDQLFAPGSFDLVVCHTLLEYVPDPGACLVQLARLLKPHGLLSVEFVNRHADVLRPALARATLREAQGALNGASSQADLFGVPRRTFAREEVAALLQAAAVDPITDYGVRVFADYLTDTRWQTDPAIYADLVALEQAVAEREPYRSMARYGLMIGQTKLSERLVTPPSGTGGRRREFWI